MNARRQILLVQTEVHHCTASMNAIPGSHTQLRSFPCPVRAFIPGHQPLATPDRYHPAGGAVLSIQSVRWQINAHFRADAGARSGSARPRIMPRLPRRKRSHVSLLPIVRHAKYMLFDQHRRGSPVDRRGGSGSPVHTIHHIPGK